MTNDDFGSGFAGAIAWLESHINYERTGPSPNAKTGLDDPERRLRHLRRMMELSGEPQTLFSSIHLTGTNGKTSTARIITALMLEQGLRTGTYTSPHLQRLNERISVNGEPIADDELADALTAIRLLEPLVGEDERLSYFEIMTAAAFRHFADAPIDVGVIEVGVGGTWDATNVVDAQVSVITNIGLDHAGYLGKTRPEVATHKAGIIKEGNIAVISEPDPQFAPIWDAREPGTILLVDRDFGVISNQVAVGGRLLDFRTPKASYSDVLLSLHGSYQASNAVTAVTAVEAFFDAPLSDEVVRAALASVKSPGRMEIVHRQPLVILDGAHNVAGATALAATIEEEFSAVEGQILVVGMLRGHEPEELLPALKAEKARLVVACTAPSPRAIPADDIAAVAKEAGVPCVVVPDVAEAVREAMEAAEDEDMVLVTGSLYVVGAARTALLG